MSTLTSSAHPNTLVQSYPDRVHGNVFRQSVPRLMPRLMPDASASGRPMLRFNGSSFLFADAAPLPEAAEEYTIVYVSRAHASPRKAELDFEMLDSATGDGQAEGVVGSQAARHRDVGATERASFDLDGGPYPSETYTHGAAPTQVFSAQDAYEHRSTTRVRCRKAQVVFGQGVSRAEGHNVTIGRNAYAGVVSGCFHGFMTYYPEFLKRVDLNARSRRYLDDLREAASDFALLGIHPDGNLQPPHPTRASALGESYPGASDALTTTAARAPTVATDSHRIGTGIYDDGKLVSLPFPTEHAQHDFLLRHEAGAMRNYSFSTHFPAGEGAALQVSALTVSGRTLGWLQAGAMAQKVLPQDARLHLAAEAAALGTIPAVAAMHEDNAFLDEVAGFRGDIGDVLVFRRALASHELLALAQNLEHKYGISTHVGGAGAMLAASTGAS